MSDFEHSMLLCLFLWRLSDIISQALGFWTKHSSNTASNADNGTEQNQ